MQLTIGELERFVGIQAGAGLARLAVQCGSHPFATAGQLEVALVRHDHGLGSAASTDDDRFRVGASLPEALEQGGQLSACLASRQHVMRIWGHAGSVANVYTKAYHYAS